MKLKIFSISLLFLILLFTNSCKENLVDSNLFDSEVYDYLPIKIGNKWIYNFSTPSENALIKREIKKQLVHEDGSIIYGFTEAVVINNPDPNEPVAGYYSQKENAIYYYSSPKDTMIPGTTILCKKIPFIKFPLTTGTTWIAENDTFKIADFSPIVVNNQSYNTILIVAKNSTYIDSTWLSKDVGIVRRKSIYPDSFVEWNLESYVIEK